MKTSLDALPEPKRERLAAIAALLQAEAPVEMVILFGSYARGDWVEDPETGYFSDFDLLAVVATEELAHKDALWAGLSQRAQALAGRAPVRIIAHDIKELNHELRLGQYFFIDILREGVRLYDSRRFQLASPKALTPADRLKLGIVNFRYWFGSASDFWRSAGHAAGRGLGPQAAFLLHQSVERYAAATLLVFTGYKPKSHNIEELANEIAALHPALVGALPRTESDDATRFDLLKRAYIEARYSRGYRITLDELRILREHVRDLALRVHQACSEKLASFCGPEHVGDLPEVPSTVDVGELPEAPSPDDPGAFQAWKDALTALSFDRGDQHGFDRGEAAARARAVLTVLEVRGMTVPDAARERILAQKDPEQLQRWLKKASVATSLDDVLEQRG